MHSNVFYVKFSNHSPNSKNYFCYNSIWHIFQNLQDTSIPEISTGLDQQFNIIIFTCTYKFWRPSYCYQNWDIHSLAKQSLLFLSIVLVLCKFVTPCTTITFKYVLFSVHFIVWLISVQGSSEIYLMSEIFISWMEWYSRSSLSFWSQITIRFDSK